MRLLIVMGVSGCGKSTIGQGLAQRLSARFVEGDDFHPQRNRQLMQAGIALTDSDRWGWLEDLANHLKQSDGIVVASCSALRRSYRDFIVNQAGEPVLFVYLDGSRELLEQRLRSRRGHFFAPSLLDSQLDTLEKPGIDENSITVSINGECELIVSNAVGQLRDKLQG